MLARSTLFETHLNPYWCAILDRLSLTGGGNPSRRPSAVSLKRSVEVNVANHTAAAAAAVPTRRKSITQSNASDASEKSLRHILVGGAVRPSAMITPLVLTVPEELGGGGRYNPTVTPANGRRNSAQFVTAAEAAVIVPKKSFSTVTTNATATVPAKTPKSKRRRPSAGGGSPQR